MSAGLNQVTLIGYLAQDVELRFTRNSTSVTDIRLAINQRRKQGEQWVDDPVFVDVTLWGKTAEVADQHLSKGSLVCIQGRLAVDQWEQDGEKRTKMKVVGERMQMLGSPGRSKPKQQGEASPPEPAAVGAGTDEEVPF